jgi:hypothetical protein
VRVTLVALLAASCGGGGLGLLGDLGSFDAAGAPPDLASEPRDLTSEPDDLASAPVDLAGVGDLLAHDLAAAKTNCMGHAVCIYSCIGAGADLNTCQTQCSKNDKPGSAQKWVDAVLCGQNYCIGDTDMMTGKCVEVAVPNMAGSFQLCDPGTTYAQCSAATYVSTSCQPCIEQARNFWFEDISVDPMNPGPPTGMCSQPTSADCMGAQAACMTSFDACRNDP